MYIYRERERESRHQSHGTAVETVITVIVIETIKSFELRGCGNHLRRRLRRATSGDVMRTCERLSQSHELEQTKAGSIYLHIRHST